MKTVTVYGLRSCDATRKGLQILQEKGYTTEFHDLREEPVAAEQLQHWCALLGWQKLLNKQSTTWRSLDKTLQDSIDNETAAVALMGEHPALVKRPVVIADKVVTAGLKESIFKQ